MPAGSCTKVSSLCVDNPFGFLSVPKSRRHTLTFESGGHSTDVWSPWLWGAHIPRRIPNSRAWGTHSAGIPQKSSVTLGCGPVLLPGCGVLGHTRPWAGAWTTGGALGKNDSSDSCGRTTTVTFFLGQVKGPQWGSARSNLPTRTCYHWHLHPHMWLVSNKALPAPVSQTHNLLAPVQLKDAISRVCKV